MYVLLISVIEIISAHKTQSIFLSLRPIVINNKMYLKVFYKLFKANNLL